MAKEKILYQCTACGHEEPKWAGRCPECGGWNTFTEKTVRPEGLSRKRERNVLSTPLSSVDAQDGTRFDAGIGEVNRVLGGGIMRGSSILVGGEPGIGKSTLMLQIAASVRTKGRVLYVSGEESPGQIKMRAERLKIDRPDMEILSETDVDAVLTVLNAVNPVLIIIDSIQTLRSQEAGPVPGTLNQIKYCVYELTSWAREHSAVIFLVAHVTKEGVIAGPKVVEHMVDTVLSFDQSNGDVRIVRSAKNRFGSTDEVGLFRMDEMGLIQVEDPMALFLVKREGDCPAGTAIAPVYEGSRILLVEIQALTVPAKGGISRVFSDRVDSGRVSRIAAVLEKHLSVRFSDQDIYVNVAGGMRISEVGIDLPLAFALYSARTSLALPAATVSAGELSLAGEIRPIPHLRKRFKTAVELGFSRFIGPQASGEGLSLNEGYASVSTIQEGIKILFGSPKTAQ